MTYKKHISQSNDLLDRFSSAFAGIKSHSNLPSGTTPFIWAIAVLIVVIFSAFYFNVRANNETILRTNLMKSTAKVADNIEMRMRGISANMARMIEKMELDGINSAVVNKYGREIISGSPEVILLRVIEPSGKGLESVVNPRLGRRYSGTWMKQGRKDQNCQKEQKQWVNYFSDPEGDIARF